MKRLATIRPKGGTRAVRLVAAAAVAALALSACGGGDDGGGDDATATEADAPASEASASATESEGSATEAEGSATEVDAGETTTVSLLSPVPPSVFFFPAFVGEELGFFAEEGVQLEYETVGDEVSATSLLVNGRVDVAVPGASEVFQGLDAGQEFDVIYDYYTAGVEGIVVPVDSPIESLEDLEGMTVGLAENEVRTLLSFSLDQVGLSLDGVTTVNIGTSGAIIANAFESGDIDVFVGGVIDFAGLQAAGFELRDITPELVAAVPGASFAVTPTRAEELGDALPGFLRAWSRALHVGMEDPERVEEIMREVAPEEWEDEEVGAATLQVALDLQRQGPEDYGSLDVEAWELGVEQALVAGDIESEIDVSTFLDDSYLDEANDFDREATMKAAN